MSHISVFLDGMRSAFVITPSPTSTKGNYISKENSLMIARTNYDPSDAWREVGSYQRLVWGIIINKSAD